MCISIDVYAFVYGYYFHIIIKMPFFVTTHNEKNDKLLNLINFVGKTRIPIVISFIELCYIVKKSSLKRYS